MKFNPKPFERRLNRYIALLYSKIEKMIDELARDVATRTLLFKPSPDNDFFFRNYPALSKMVDGLLTKTVREITKSLKAGIEWSWDLSNTKNDDMVAAIVKSIGAERIPAEALLRWQQKNLPALQAFENRRIAGLDLSERVWNFMSGVKGDLELALDLGIGEGMSADRMSRAVRSYLREPSRLYRRVRDEKGILRLSKSASNYHPGQGVYRSSYKNAKRLAATETNISYRSADNERMNEIDWILGFEVHLSNNHTCLDSQGKPQPFFDICDILQGRYPKWFKFTGWHPNCRCYTTTILPSQDEFIDYLASMDEEGNSPHQFKGYVEDVPPQMKAWLRDNEQRILNANSLPYWLRDNPQIAISSQMRSRMDYEGLTMGLGNAERNSIPVAKETKPADQLYLIERDIANGGVIEAMRRAREVGDEVQGMAERIAEQYGATVTPINYKKAKSIKRKCRSDVAFPSELKDTVRTTIVAPSETIPAIIAELQKQDGFMRWKAQRPEDFMGYSGNIINFRASNGVVAEIQVNTARMIYAKEGPKGAKSVIGEAVWNEIFRETKLYGGLGHRYYEKIRVLPSGDAEKERLIKLMEEYYSHFN